MNLKNMRSSLGYIPGDISLLQHVYKLLGGKLCLQKLLDSKYLRFWSGTTSDLQSLWIKGVGAPSRSVSYQQLPNLLELLDEVSERVRKEMEQENLKWVEADLEHDLLCKFFSSNSEEGLLCFQEFMKWSKVKEEMWYNEKVLSVENIAERWTLLAGSTEGKIEFEQFCTIYDDICRVDYAA